MKNLINITICAFGIFLLSSCSKSDPQLEIFVSLTNSDAYSSVILEIESIDFGNVSEGEVTGGSNVQQYAGATVEFNLSDEVRAIKIADESHWADSFGAAKLSITSVELADANGNRVNANLPVTNANLYKLGDFELLEGESYRIDYIYNLDACLEQSTGGVTFVPKFDVNITRN